jgi:hypothetical protein
VLFGFHAPIFSGSKKKTKLIFSFLFPQQDRGGLGNGLDMRSLEHCLNDIMRGVSDMPPDHLKGECQPKKVFFSPKLPFGQLIAVWTQKGRRMVAENMRTYFYVNTFLSRKTGRTQTQNFHDMGRRTREKKIQLVQLPEHLKKRAQKLY